MTPRILISLSARPISSVEFDSWQKRGGRSAACQRVREAPFEGCQVRIDHVTDGLDVDTDVLVDEDVPRASVAM